MVDIQVQASVQQERVVLVDIQGQASVQQVRMVLVGGHTGSSFSTTGEGGVGWWTYRVKLQYNR